MNFVLCNQSNNTGATDVKMDGSVLEEKSSFKMLGLTFSSKLDWGSYIISIAKTASKKIGVLIRSMKFLSPEVALYLYKSTIQPCMKYYCHAWASAPSCYLELLDKLHKRICKQGLIQDLNLGGRTNLVSFTVAINIVSDPRHAAEGSWAIL